MAKRKTALAGEPPKNNKPDNRKFTYDAIQQTGKRRQAMPLLRSEDNELLPYARRQLVANARDLQRNSTIFSFILDTHMDYICNFTFQARNDDETLNNELEDYMRIYSRAANCDVTGRFSLQKMVRMLEQRAIIDGDCGLIKLYGGYLQAVEGDRIRNPEDQADVFNDEWVQGVHIDKYGAAKEYSIYKRDSGYYAYDRCVPSRNFILHGYWQRFDQIRGITPLTGAMNSIIDVMEANDYALTRAKISQIMAMAMTRTGADPIGPMYPDVHPTTVDQNVPMIPGFGGGDGSSPTPETQNVSFGNGPQFLQLEPGEKIEWLESNQPSIEYQQFFKLTVQCALKGLNMPYSFYDSRETSFSGGRQDKLQYQRSAEGRQAEIQQLLNNITAWRLSLAIMDGDLKLPAGMTVSDLKWEWVAAGMPLTNPLQEGQADIQDLAAGLNSRQRILKARGEDWKEVVKEIAAENEQLKALGLPTVVDAAKQISISENTKEGNKE